ncbi:MAG: glutamate--tRNA ligase [Gammaproteobacteria bacterium]
MKTRFCPSPTGNMHLGNARTALFNALLSIKEQGTFLLRIEDTDVERSKPEYTSQLQNDLTWLGLPWQEGPEVGGSNGPYYQSERQALYDKYYQQLETENLAYPCFCSEQQLSLARKLQRAAGKPPRYPGTCRSLSPEDVAEKIAAGEKATLRFRVPDNQLVTFTDTVRGEQRFESHDLGDFIIRRANGTAPFMYCNAIDDATMGVTHVLRGEDHLTNTPRQVLILQALGLPLPQYGHIALITGADGSPLSKRHGSRSIQDLKTAGFLPLAIVNYLARLGHYYAENNYGDVKTLAAYFDVEHLSKSPARFDENQLLYWQKEAVHALSDDDFYQWLGEALWSKVPKEQQKNFMAVVRPNVLFPEEATEWAQIIYDESLIHNDEGKNILQEADISFFEAAQTAFETCGADFSAVAKEVQQITGKKGKGLFMPLRVALTGQCHGPEMKPLVSLLGVELCMQRLQQVITELG